MRQSAAFGRPLFLVLVLFIPCFAIAALLLPRTDTPYLTCEQPELQFLDCKPGIQDCRFEVTNNSNRDIRILKAIQTCTCTDVRINRSILLPGETSVVQCKWDLRSRTGSASSSLNIVYGVDGEEDLKSLTLDMNATMSPYIQTEPRILSFTKGIPEELCVRLVSDAVLFSVLDATLHHPSLNVTVEDENIITVEYDGGTSNSSSRTFELVIETDHADQPSVTVPVILNPSGASK